jgi:hypothetical protein
MSRACRSIQIVAAALAALGASAPAAGATAQTAPAAQPAHPPPPPVATPGVPPATPPPALPPPVVEPAPAALPPASGAPGAPAAPAPAARGPGPIPTADATAAPSDHDAVVGHLGIEARRIQPAPFPLALRSDTGCPAGQTTPCEVQMGALEARYWGTRNLAVDAGLAFAFGGGSQGGRALDSYVGAGPVLGLTLLLGNWRHLAVGASPEATVVWFKPGGGSTKSTTLVDLRATLEGELHFGFVGVPALSVGLQAGLGFRYESTPDARVWSVAVVGADSVWGALSNLFVRYYL